VGGASGGKNLEGVRGLGHHQYIGVTEKRDQKGPGITGVTSAGQIVQGRDSGAKGTSKE